MKRISVILGVVVALSLSLFLPAMAKKSPDPGYLGFPLKYFRILDYDHPFPTGKGLYIYRIDENGAPARHGLEQGDIIRSINGQPVRDMLDVTTILDGTESDTFNYTVYQVSPKYQKKIRNNPLFNPRNMNIYDPQDVSISYTRSTREQVPVVSSHKSNLYHRRGLRHTPHGKTVNKFSNQDRAEQTGLDPCPICFPSSKGTVLGSIIQSELGSASQFERNLRDKYDVMQTPARLQDVVSRMFPWRLDKTSRPGILVLNTPDFISLGLPDGKVIMSTGLLEMIESENELAAQVGHLMAHTDLNHDPSPVEKRRLRSLFERAIKRTTGVTVSFEDLKRISPGIPGFKYYRDLLEQGYGEKTERESLFFAMVYMYRAGYSMDGIQALLRKRQDMESQLDARWIDHILKHPIPSEIKQDVHFWKERIPKKLQVSPAE